MNRRSFLNRVGLSSLSTTVSATGIAQASAAFANDSSKKINVADTESLGIPAYLKKSIRDETLLMEPENLTVACYTFPNYHPSVIHNKLYGPGWTEYNLFRPVRLWFEGHQLLKCCCFFLCMYLPNLLSGQSPYIDGRPWTDKRIVCKDDGIVLRYGDGPANCDAYGAREANVVKDNGTYYLFYDGAGKDGWKSCLAESKDLKHWIKKGAILQLGKPGANDSKSASAPWVIKEGKTWHMFYLGTPHTSPPPDRIPSFPYLTMKAKSTSLEGPWVKQYDVTPFFVKENSFYSVTASPGFIVKYNEEYLQFFSGATQDSSGTKRTLGIATTKNLDGPWTVNEKPIFPITEQVENSSVYYEPANKTWYLFTNHIGIDKNKTEYTDAIWVYWSKNIYHWNENDKAVVLDSINCTWSKGAIGMPSVIRVGNKLAVLYDAYEGYSTYHMRRNIGLAWIDIADLAKRESD